MSCFGHAAFVERGSLWYTDAEWPEMPAMCRRCRLQLTAVMCTGKSGPLE